MKQAYDLHTVHTTILQKGKKIMSITYTTRIFINYTTVDRRNNYTVPKAGLNIVKNYIKMWLRYVTLKYCLIF